MPSSLDDLDFFEWTQSVGENLRRGRLSPSDLRHVAEEIASLGKRDRRELFSGVAVLLTHLIKWAAQPERRRGSTWMDTIAEQRLQIALNLQDSPSLRCPLILEMPKLHARAVRRAAEETGISLKTLERPEAAGSVLLDIDRVLSDWLPETPDDLAG